MSEKIEITIDAEEILRALEHINSEIDSTEDNLASIDTTVDIQSDKIDDTEDQLLEMAESVDTQTERIGDTEIQLLEMVESVDTQTENSYNEVMEMMQDTYEKQGILVEDVEIQTEKTKENVMEMMQDSYAKQSELVEDVKEEAVRSFNEVMGYMRASYLLISGVSRILGGNMTQAFSMLYSVGVSAIGTYKAIAAAMAATGPAGWVQAGLMMISLTTATSSLMAILVGQRELSTKIRGINMSLHGISALIGSANYFL